MNVRWCVVLCCVVLIGVTAAMIFAIEDATRDGHFEFLIPHLNRWRIPVASVN